jgi:hypothetical protein
MWSIRLTSDGCWVPFTNHIIVYINSLYLHHATCSGITTATPPEVSPIPPAQFYHDPVLFTQISQLKSNMAALQGHLKMVELELQNEKCKNNEQANKLSKRQKLNMEAQVLTLVEGKQLAVEKDAERKAKEQKKKDVAA